jgi:DNA-binding MarR family transcriptional regulator
MTDPTDLDAIAAALGQLRGGRRPPFGPPGFGPPGSFGPAGGSTGSHGAGHEHLGPFGRGRGPGPGGFGPHARFGGGPARLRLLEALAAASHPLSVSEVGEAIGVDQPRASRLIQQAVELGLVRREADPDDARRTRTALTDEGRTLARGFRGQRREQLQEALADFTEAERADLARLLTKLAAAWPAR